MTKRQQLQATIKTLKAQKLIPAKFDARQANHILEAKIAEIQTGKPASQPFEAPKTEFMPLDSKKTIRKVVSYTCAVTGKEVTMMVNAIYNAGNKAAADRTKIENLLVSKFVADATRYAAKFNKVA